MKLLLDTHVVLWWLDDQNLIADDAVEAISEPENAVLVSAVVAWEIAIKRALGKLTAPHNLGAVIASAGFDQLPITLSHALGIEALPEHHRDPFVLVAQAKLETSEQLIDVAEFSMAFLKKGRAEPPRRIHLKRTNGISLLDRFKLHSHSPDRFVLSCVPAMLLWYTEAGGNESRFGFPLFVRGRS